MSYQQKKFFKFFDLPCMQRWYCRIDCIKVVCSDVGVSVMSMLSERLLVVRFGRDCADWLGYKRALL